MGLKDLLNRAKISSKNFIKNHDRGALTGITIGGSLGSTILAIDATIKAVEVVKKEKLKTKKEIVKKTWKFYVPTVVCLGLSITSAIFCNTIASKKIKVLAAAYTLSETAFSQYKEKVIEKVGEKKERTIREELAADQIKKNPPKNQEVIITGSGNNLIYDTFSGHYFRSDMESIRAKVNDLNARLLRDNFISYNEFRYEFGLKPTRQGDDFGWNLFRDGLIDITYGASLTDNGEPAVAMYYHVEPRMDFQNLH